MSENAGDDPAVVGEPASQPHRAAVVGEPPDVMVPALGEPVPLANGLQTNQQPDSSLPANESNSAINGIHEESSPAVELPPQLSDAASSESSNVESPNPTMVEEHIASAGARIVDGTHIVPAENPIPPESAMETSVIHAEETPDVSEFSCDINDVNPDADNSADVEVTSIVDVPSEEPLPDREVATENPFSVLNAPEADAGVSIEGEEPAGEGVTGEPDEQAVAAVEEDESTKGLDAPPQVELQEVDATMLPPVHEEITKDLGLSAEPCEQTEPTVVNDEGLEETMPAVANEEAHEETVPTVANERLEEKNVSNEEPAEKNVSNEIFEEHAASNPTEAENLCVAEPRQAAAAFMEECVECETSGKATVEGAPDYIKDLVSTGDEKGDEAEKMEDRDTNSGTSSSEVEHAHSIEASLPISKEEVFAKEGEVIKASAEGFHGGAILDDAVSTEVPDKAADSDGQIASDEALYKDASQEAFPMESSGPRSIAVEASPDNQPPSDETLLSENGFQHGEDATPLERDQCETKDEKPSSHFKRPLIITSVLIAVVGVAAASINRSRQ